MESDKAARRRRRSVVRRAWLHCLLLGLPAIVLGAVWMYQSRIGLAPALMLGGCLLLYLLLVAAALIEGLVRPLQTLSNLLWAGFGVNRLATGGRTAPSAMNWQETSVYVVNSEGAYVYDAKAHALRLVAAGDHRGDTGVQPFVKDAPVNLIYVADFAKTGKSTAEEKTFYTAADVGFIAQNVYLFCASEGLAAVGFAPDVQPDSPDLQLFLEMLPRCQAQRLGCTRKTPYPNPARRYRRFCNDPQVCMPRCRLRPQHAPPVRESAPVWQCRPLLPAKEDGMAIN